MMALSLLVLQSITPLNFLDPQTLLTLQFRKADSQTLCKINSSWSAFDIPTTQDTSMPTHKISKKPKNNKIHNARFSHNRFAHLYFPLNLLDDTILLSWSINFL